MPLQKLPVAMLPDAPGWSDGTGGGMIYSPGPQFNQPIGPTRDPRGNLIVADWGNSVIRQVTPSANVTTVAGVGSLRGLKDDTGGSARFDISQGRSEAIDCTFDCPNYSAAAATAAADGLGNVYIADTGNGVIRKITPGGVVTTLPGWIGLLNGGITIDSGGNIYFTASLDLNDGTLYPSVIEK